MTAPDDPLLIEPAAQQTGQKNTTILKNFAVTSRFVRDAGGFRAVWSDRSRIARSRVMRAVCVPKNRHNAYYQELGAPEGRLKIQLIFPVPSYPPFM